MKKTSVFLVFVLLLSMLAGCGATEEKAPEASSAPVASEQAAPSTPSTNTDAEKSVYKLRFSLQNNEAEANSVGARAFAEKVSELTDGRITCEIYYSGTAFAQEMEIPAILQDNIDMSMSDANFLAQYFPKVECLTMGFIFSDYEHMTKVLNGDIGYALYDEIAEEVGVRPLGAAYFGARCLNLRTDKEVTSRADMAGVKLRMPNTETYMYLGEAMGANPIGINYTEVYTALQTGTCDGQDNPLPATYSNKFYEVTESITMTNHTIGQNWPIISEKVFSSFDPETQDAVIEACQYMISIIDEANKTQEKELIDTLRSEGFAVYEPDMSAFGQEVVDYYKADTDYTGDWDWAWIEEIRAMA